MYISFSPSIGHSTTAHDEMIPHPFPWNQPLVPGFVDGGEDDAPPAAPDTIYKCVSAPTYIAPPASDSFMSVIPRWAETLVPNLDPSLSALAAGSVPEIVAQSASWPHSMNQTPAYDEAQKAAALLRRAFAQSNATTRSSRKARAVHPAATEVVDATRARIASVASQEAVARLRELGFTPWDVTDFIHKHTLIRLSTLAENIDATSGCAGYEMLTCYLRAFLAAQIEKVRQAFPHLADTPTEKIYATYRSSFVSLSDFTDFLAVPLQRTGRPRIHSLNREERYLLSQLGPHDGLILVSELKAFLADKSHFTLFPGLRDRILDR